MNEDNRLPYQERIIKEKAELDLKIEALTKFIERRSLEVTSSELGRLTLQLALMNQYSKVLGERIENFSKV